MRPNGSQNIVLINGLKALYCIFQIGLKKVRVEEVKEGCGNARPYPALLSSFSHSFREEVHVVEKHRPAFEHLNTGKLRSPVNSLFVKLCFQRPYFLLQPLVQLHVVSVASEQRHGCMGVGVEEARNYCLFTAIYDNIALILPLSRYFSVFNLQVSLNQPLGVRILAFFIRIIGIYWCCWIKWLRNCSNALIL